MCVCVCVCVFGQNFFVDTYLIKNMHIFVYIFFISPFKLLYRFYFIKWEFVNTTSIINWFPCTFCPVLGLHQGVYILEKRCNFCNLKR